MHFRGFASRQVLDIPNTTDVLVVLESFGIVTFVLHLRTTRARRRMEGSRSAIPANTETYLMISSDGRCRLNQRVGRISNAATDRATP